MAFIKSSLNAISQNMEVALVKESRFKLWGEKLLQKYEASEFCAQRSKNSVKGNSFLFIISKKKNFKSTEFVALCSISE